MTVLVTGSAGHLGEALMRTLRAAGRPARGLDLLASPWTDAIGSIADPVFVAEAMAGVTAVIHAATLHKPHVETHSRQAFVDANVTGTLTLLEAATRAGVDAFVMTSTTSAFGAALTPGPGEPAAWITEDVQPVPRNIYGVTKTAAESLCERAHRVDGLPVVVLRTSRFFPEADDDAAVSAAYPLQNVQANELLYRRVDIEDVVAAHLLALERAPGIGFGRYIVSATTPSHVLISPSCERTRRQWCADSFPIASRSTGREVGGSSPASTGSTSTSAPVPTSAGARSTTSARCWTHWRAARTSAAN